MSLLERAHNGAPGGKPLILFYNDFFGHPPDTQSLRYIETCAFTTDRRKFDSASAVVFHVPSMRKLGRVRKRNGQLWIAWSMESEINYPLLADRAFMRNFDLTMTYRRSADIWCPYLPAMVTFQKALATPVAPKHAGAPVVMFQSASLDRSGRNSYVAELMKHIGIHSYGRFLKNRSLTSEDLGGQTKLSVIANYKFCIAFENSIAEDYVTEKFFDPLLAGTVPIYLGAPNVDKFAPAGISFVNVAEFSGPSELARFLTHLDGDETAYRRYLQWREDGLTKEFLDLLSAASRDPFERLAEFVVARGSTRTGWWRWPWRRSPA